MRTALGLAAALLMALPGAANASELVGVCGGNLCSAPETGGTPAPFTTDGGYSAPAVSADGSRLLWLRNGAFYEGGYHAAAPKLLFDTDAGRETAISPDGRSIILRTFDGRVGPGGYQLESNLRVVGAAGSALYSSTRFVHTAGWLGASQLIVTYPDDAGGNDYACSTAIIPSDTTPPCATVVAKSPERHVDVPRGSADGRYVVAETETRNPDESVATTRITLFDAATGAPVRDLSPGPADLQPNFSPDGRNVVFSRGEDTYVVPVAGGEPQLRVAGMTQAVWGGPAPTPGPALRSTPAGKVKLKGRRLTFKAVCATGTCAKATWKLAGLKLKVPAVTGTRTLSVKLSKTAARKVRGKRVKLSGPGFKTRKVRVSG